MISWNPVKEQENKFFNLMQKSRDATVWLFFNQVPPSQQNPDELILNIFQTNIK